MSKLTVKPIVLSRSLLGSVMGPFSAADALPDRFHEEDERVKLRLYPSR